MAKRFTDTLIWEKEWFMKLTPKHKCLFKFIVDRCDPSGVWEQNWKLASIYIGENCDYSDTFLFADQVELLPSGKILVKDFISFQYGKLSEKCAAHIPIFKAIEKNKLSLDRLYNRVLYTLKEKEMDMEKEKEEEIKEVQEEKQIHIGQVNGSRITVKAKYLHDPHKIIHDLEEYFRTMGQLADIQRAGWIDYKGFMKANPGAMFDDDNHLYHSFKKFSTTQPRDTKTETQRRREAFLKA